MFKKKNILYTLKKKINFTFQFIFLKNKNLLLNYFIFFLNKFDYYQSNDLGFESLRHIYFKNLILILISLFS